MQTQISLNTLRLHNDRLDQLIKEVEDYFDWQPVTPKDDLSSIMYRAGQASVVAFMKNKLEED
jgi:hypothetical protein